MQAHVSCCLSTAARVSAVALALALAGAGVARAEDPRAAGAPIPADTAATTDTTATDAATADVPVGGRVAAAKACYVRLPDLPAGRYGGFGAYNDRTGVLAYAGGADKLADDITRAYGDVFAIRLDGSAAWATVAGAGDAGYARANDRGCREMASVRVDGDRWASVFGKDGCDNGRFSSDAMNGGDIKELVVGATAAQSGVRWVPNSGVQQLVDRLVDTGGQLSRPFAAFDGARQRIVFGQGTSDSGSDKDTYDEVYAAARVGHKFQVRRLRPAAEAGSPGRRYGACAAYVRQPDRGVDGIVVIGGRFAETSFADVWWLDFGRSADGAWVDLTPRIANMDAFGARREGACAYDEASGQLYAWMGRVDGDIPDGASRSSGAWRLDLGRLADGAAPLQWERLAPDNLKGVPGRHMIPSVWDAANRRMLAVGGRKSLEAYADVWAIYPDVDKAACEALDPYAPFRSAVPGPTAPAPTPAPTSAAPAPDPAAPIVCAGLRGKVPPAVLNQALSNPYGIQGYGERQFPNLPAGPQNPRRRHLQLRNPGLAWDMLFNGLIYRAGCS